MPTLIVLPNKTGKRILRNDISMISFISISRNIYFLLLDMVKRKRIIRISLNNSLWFLKMQQKINLNLLPGTCHFKNKSVQNVINRYDKQFLV